MNCGCEVWESLWGQRAQEVCKKAMKHILILQSGANQSMCGSLWVRDGLLDGHWDWTAPSVAHLLYWNHFDRALCEAEGMILRWVLLKGSVESLALAQAHLHSSGASCPVLSLLTPTEASWNHKGVAVSGAPPHPGPIIICWRGEADFRSA